MRIFTLGKNGIPLFFFAFILFSGTYSSYGQCPTVDDPDQEVCYATTVAELSATIDNGGTVKWYRDADDTNPIPDGEFLETGIYYAGNEEGTCENRPIVNVTVNILPSPTSRIGNFYQPCDFGGTQNQITVQNLVDNIIVTDPTYSVEVFTEEFSGTALAYTTPLANGNYFISQRDPVSGCSSERIAIDYSPVSAVAPTGEALQTFCTIGVPAPTVADLEASGNHRWYSTATSNPALSPSTVLVDGETYYASSFQNRNGTNNPPCESIERLEVTVDLIGTVVPETQEFCAVIERTEDFGRPVVSDLSPAGATWFTDETLSTEVDPTTELVDGAIYFTDPTPDDCSVTSVTVTILPTPNAGMTSEATVCVNEGVVDLFQYIGDSLLGTPDTNGTFDDEAFTGTSVDPAALGVGTHDLFYTVPAIGACGPDSSAFTLTIVEAPVVGEPVDQTFCASNIADSAALAALFTSTLDGRDQGGTFDINTTQEVEVFDIDQTTAFFTAQYEVDPLGTYSATYTVENENECTESVDITFSIITDPNAGDDAIVNLTNDDTAIVDLFDALNGTPDAGGVWTDAEGNEVDGNFDPLTETPGVFFYTITAGGCTDSASVTVTIPFCPVVTEPIQDFCEAFPIDEGTRSPQIMDLQPQDATWYASETSTEALAGTTPLVTGTVYYAGNAEGTCTERETVTVNIFAAPNAGGTTTVNLCESQGEFDLFARIQDSDLGAPDAGGTFDPPLASGNTMFDPAVDPARDYVYTVETTNPVCTTDSAVISVIISTDADAGPDTTLEFCSNDGPQDLFARLAEAGVSTAGSFDTLVDGIFDPAVDASGEYTYTVAPTGECQTPDTAVYTISVAEAPEAPAVSDQTFCASEAATVATLTATVSGSNIQWYSDAALTTPANEADVLTAATYYVTQTNAAGCESDAAALTVTLNDPGTPSLNAGGNVFCRYDNPTLAELEANVSGTGPITWYSAATGGSVLSTSELLSDGSVYYASLTDATSGCESSARLAVTADLGNCTFDIPEAFSPNGDGINDRFEIENLAAEYPNYSIEIFNRWGNVVFKGNASNSGWDGVSSEGSIGDGVVPVGVYFYILNYNDGQTAPTQGRLYLSR